MSLKRQIKYEDYVSGGQISIELTASNNWSFKADNLDKMNRRDLHILRNFIAAVIEEQEREDDKKNA